MAISVNTTAGTSVTVSVSGSTQASFTTESTSVSVTAPASSSVSVLGKGTKGDKGDAGPTGQTGQNGEGVPTGGVQYQLLRKDTSDNYDTSWAFADRVTIEVRVDEAVSKGDPLYITGYNSGQNRITVAKADAADSSKMPSIGLARDDYSQNDNGQATCIGSLEDVNTQVSPNDFQEGDVLYVKAGGGLTNVKPTGTNLIQNVGKVGRRQQNNGEIVVMAIGRSNDVPNIPDGQAWIGNSSGVATPTTLADVATSGAYSDISGTPSLAAVATSGSASDLSGGTLPVARGGTGRTGLTDNSLLIGNSTGAIESPASLTYDGNTLKIYDADTGAPSFQLEADGFVGPSIVLDHDRFGQAANPTYQLGTFDFRGNDSGSNDTTYARIQGYAETSTNGQEGGQLRLIVASHNGALVEGIRIHDGSASSEVDVEIGNGQFSQTTIAGELIIGGDVSSQTVALKAKSDRELQIRSDKTVSVMIDSDNDGSELFEVVNSANVTQFSVSELGDVNAPTYTGQYFGLHTRQSSLSATGHAEGNVVYFGNDSTDVGKLYTYNTGTWVEAKNDAEATTKGLLGLALGTNSTTDGMLIYGVYRLANLPVAAGTTLYVSSVGGGTQATAPGAGKFSRIIGYVVGADNSLLFCPSQDYIEVA